MKSPDRSENDLQNSENADKDKFRKMHFSIRVLILVFAALISACASGKTQMKNSDIPDTHEFSERPIRFGPRTDPFCWNRVEGLQIVKRCLAQLDPDLFNWKSRMKN